MLCSFVALVVADWLVKLKQHGLIADRQFIQKIISANGKSFIIVNVMLFGGLGVAIAQVQNLAIGKDTTTVCYSLMTW
jgi:hypothetical protein